MCETHYTAKKVHNKLLEEFNLDSDSAPYFKEVQYFVSNCKRGKQGVHEYVDDLEMQLDAKKYSMDLADNDAFLFSATTGASTWYREGQ